jgi:hypothetical protein
MAMSSLSCGVMTVSMAATSWRFVVGGDEGRADPDGVAAQFEDVDVAQGQGAGGGVSGVGGAVLEDRRLLAVAVERLPDARRDQGAAQRGVAGGDALGEGDQVRVEAVSLILMRCLLGDCGSR